MKRAVAPICAAALAAFVAVPAAAQEVRAGLSAVDIFDEAAKAEEAERYPDAIAFYDALIANPDLEIRTEARFRKAMLLTLQGENENAAILLRRILDDKPEATRVRLELARILTQMGDEAGARRAFRQARAQELPPEVAALVDRYVAALRSTKPFGGSVQFGLAPDSNINRATSARTLETVIAPLTLSEDARAQSGLGVQAAGQAYLRVPLTGSLSFLPRVAGRGTVYGKSDFNDISASALAGLEWRRSSDRFAPSVGRTWRWYGQELYATTDTLAASWLHLLDARTQLTVSGSASHASYKRNPLQTGGLFDLSAGVERALTARTGVAATLGGTIQTARDPGYATKAGYLNLSGWHDLGRATLFASCSVRRTEGDERLALFADRRKEWLLSASAGIALRAIQFKGFSPTASVSIEHNASSIGLYDYTRFSTEIGIVRAF